MLRVISGKLKNRVIPTSTNVKFKPSTTRTREAIFSIIASWSFEKELNGANVLDVFCGSGSLGVEALSRGAGFVGFIDSNAEQIVLLKAFIAKVGEEKNTGLIHAAAERLPYSNKLYDIVLMDPPYFTSLAGSALMSLKKNKWLADGAIIILEVATKEDVKLPAGFEEVDRRVYGNNKLLFLQYSQNMLSESDTTSAECETSSLPHENNEPK
jgi:16S rRNA (guanine966-N2)-methyltransferase